MIPPNKTQQAYMHNFIKDYVERGNGDDEQFIRSVMQGIEASDAKKLAIREEVPRIAFNAIITFSLLVIAVSFMQSLAHFTAYIAWGVIGSAAIFFAASPSVRKKSSFPFADHSTPYRENAIRLRILSDRTLALIYALGGAIILWMTVQ